eukprot:1927226-Prorocentrum_lima.AAC.1
MLFWGGSPLITAPIPADLRNVRAITRKRAEKVRVFFQETSTTILKPPYHPGYFIRPNYIKPLAGFLRQHHKVDVSWAGA